MLGETLTLTVNAVDKVLTKIDGSTPYQGEYLLRTSTEEFRVKVRHSKTKATAVKAAKERHNFEVVHTTFATETVAETEQKFYTVHEHEAQDGNVDVPAAVCVWLTASSNANLISMVGWES